MRLFIFRHGEAVSVGQHGIYTDEERCLTDKGRLDVKKMGLYLRRQSQKIDLLIHSPLIRAVETAEILANEIGCERQLIDFLSTDFGVERYIEVIKSFDNRQRLAMVAHQPTLTKLVSIIISGEQHSDIRFDPSSLAIMKIAISPRLNGELQTLISPNDI